jgi:hypothetical protein
LMLGHTLCGGAIRDRRYPSPWFHNVLKRTFVGWAYPTAAATSRRDVSQCVPYSAEYLLTFGRALRVCLTSDACCCSIRLPSYPFGVGMTETASHQINEVTTRCRDHHASRPVPSQTDFARLPVTAAKELVSSTSVGPGLGGLECLPAQSASHLCRESGVESGPRRLRETAR